VALPSGMGSSQNAADVLQLVLLLLSWSVSNLLTSAWLLLPLPPAALRLP
jgi:hypothetical protein